MCFHTRGDEIRNSALCSARRATARSDWAATPRPHQISYVPLVDRTLIFFIDFAQQRLKNVTQSANCQRRERDSGAEAVSDSCGNRPGDLTICAPDFLEPRLWIASEWATIHLECPGRLVLLAIAR